MDYEKKYLDALANARQEYNTTEDVERKQWLEELFPELEESEDEKIRKELIDYHRSMAAGADDYMHEAWIAWLEKQKEYESTDFDYVWETTECSELTSALDKYSEDAIKKVCHAWYDKGIELERKNWLEKQGEKDNWAEELNTKIKELHKQCLEKIQEYVTPCLGKMSEEDERIRKEIINLINDLWKEKQGLMTDRKDYERYIDWLKKQGKKQPIIVWHSINEEPEEMKELFCEWESDDATWHDVAFYDKESHTFRHAKMSINVTKWIYVDELLGGQGEQKPAWSEADEYGAEKLLGWIDTLVNYIHHDVTVSLDLRRDRMQQVEQLKNWLKSLKDRLEQI